MAYRFSVGSVPPPQLSLVSFAPDHISPQAVFLQYTGGSHIQPKACACNHPTKINSAGFSSLIVSGLQKLRCARHSKHFSHVVDMQNDSSYTVEKDFLE
jgi:hypothetical protein